MKSKIILIAIFVLFLSISVHSEELYVSPNAADGGDGSQQAPYSTLAEAKSKVRELNTLQSEDIYVYLMDGIYNLTETLEFTPDDSGKNGYKVIYKAYDGATPILSGGVQITDWKLYDKEKNIWRAEASGYDSRQLYVNGVKAVRARTNSSSEIPASVLTETDTGYTVTAENYEKNSIIKKIFEYSNISDAEFVYEKNFHHQRMGIASVGISEDDKIITMDSGFSKITDKTAISWIENAYELLDQQGEWYLNKNDRYVYYMPRDGEDMETANVIMPVLEQLIYGNGSDIAYDKGVSTTVDNIEFDGLTFMYTTWLGLDTEEGYPASQGGFGYDFRFDNNTIGLKQALRIDRGKNITVKNCIFKELGCGAVRLGCATKNSTITNNEVYNCAGGGIYVEEKQRSWTDTAKTYLLENNTVSYNSVHDIGTEYYSCVGIFIGYGTNFLITNNEVYNTPYTGISIGWGWNDNGTEAFYKTDVPNKDNKIYSNIVHDVMQKLSDGGGIYNLGTQPGMEIQNNIVYNVGASDGAAYYLDNGSRFINMQNNIGHDAAIIVYAKGEYNNVKDNYFANYRYIYPNSPDPTTVISDNTDVTDGNYPKDIIALAGIKNKGIKVSISGKTDPNKTVYYGLFNKNGVNTAEDIFYINDTKSSRYGNYTVTLTLDLDSLSDYSINTSESGFAGSVLENPDEYTFKPYEFYDIYDANASKTDNSLNVTSVFSARNTALENIRIIAAVYDSDGKLVGASHKDYSQFSTAVDTFTIDCGEYTGTYKVKIMMWDSVNGMKSLTEFLPLTFEEEIE